MCKGLRSDGIGNPDSGVCADRSSALAERSDLLTHKESPFEGVREDFKSNPLPRSTTLTLFTAVGASRGGGKPSCRAYRAFHGDPFEGMERQFGRFLSENPGLIGARFGFRKKRRRRLRVTSATSIAR